MMDKADKEAFELAVKCFGLMKPVEQGMVLVFFRKKKGPIIEGWCDSVHKVVKSLQKAMDKK